MDNKETIQTPETTSEETIFSGEEFSMQGYDKHIRQARNAIFFVAGLLLLNVIFLIVAAGSDTEYLWIDIAIWGAFIMGFLFLGFYCKKKPYYAIVSALCLYGLFIALNAYIDTSTLFKGILMKIIVIVLLVKGVKDAKEAQEMQKNFSRQPSKF